MKGLLWLMLGATVACSVDSREVIIETVESYCDRAVEECDPDLLRVEQCENPWSEAGLQAAAQGEECLRRWQTLMLCVADAPCDEVPTPFDAPSCMPELASLEEICFSPP